MKKKNLDISYKNYEFVIFFTPIKVFNIVCVFGWILINPILGNIKLMIVLKVQKTIQKICCCVAY